MSIFYFLSVGPVQCINNPTGVPRMFVPTPAFRSKKKRQHTNLTGRDPNEVLMVHFTTNSFPV